MLENGTPSACKRLIDQSTCACNKCMRTLIPLEMFFQEQWLSRVLGPNSGPASVMWYVLLEYILYQGFCVYQYAQLEKKLDHFTTFKQLQKAKQTITFRSYLYHMSNANSFGEMVLQKNFSVKENINRRSTVQDTFVPSFEAIRYDEAINDISSVPKLVG